jgi:hypothetical protein
MQIQMALLFFYSAVSKLGGDDWWFGDAVWYVFTTDEHYSPFLLDVLASQYWLVNVATYATILIEIAYPFMIWQRHTRPYLLAGAIFLHAQFALLMGLFYFSFVMMMGHLSFVRPEWLTRLGMAWKRKIGDMEMIYDGRCGFCFRSMAWFLAFDGATRNWKRRSIWSCLTDGRCQASKPIVMSCCACRGYGGRFRSSTCRSSAVGSDIPSTTGSPRTEAGSRH